MIVFFLMLVDLFKGHESWSMTKLSGVDYPYKHKQAKNEHNLKNFVCFTLLTLECWIVIKVVLVNGVWMTMKT